MTTPPVALITGAARRIGAYIARTLHAQGMNVVVHYRQNQASAETLCDALNAIRAHSAVAIGADFNQFDALSHLITHAAEHWQRLDLLINNASEFFPTAVHESTEQQWETLIASNLKGPYFLAANAAPFLNQQQGSIINIIDIHGQKPLKGYPIYSIAKAGLTMLTQSLARELAPNIRVNAIAPGNTLWPEDKNQLSEQQKTRLLDRAALKRQVDPQHIADGVWFLAQNSSITGQIINIDCGR